MTSDNTRPGKELAKLEAEDPRVAAAAKKLEEVSRQIVDEAKWTPLEKRLKLLRQQERRLSNIIDSGNYRSPFMCDSCAPADAKLKLTKIRDRIAETEDLIVAGKTNKPPSIPTKHHLDLIRKNAEECGANGRIYLSRAEAMGIFALMDMFGEALEDARDHFHQGEEACPYEEPCMVVCAALNAVKER